MNAKRGTPHFFPACVSGGFGRPASGKRASRRRYATVAVRNWDRPEDIFEHKADAITKEAGHYRVQNPPPGFAPDFIDTFWDGYETYLPGAIDALESGRYTSSHWHVILAHVQAQSARNPDFLAKAAAHLETLGITDPTWDQLQYERVRTLFNTPALMSQCRFALVHRPHDGRRFVVNDKGYARILDVEPSVINVFFPLSGETAVQMVVDAAQLGDDIEAGPMRELTMTPTAVECVNQASWSVPDIVCIMGHPDDGRWMLELDTAVDLTRPWLGPYRGTCDVDLSDWAVSNQAATRLTVHVS